MVTDHEMRMEALRLYEENEKLRVALDRLVKRLDSIHEHPAYQSVWTVHQLHAGSYCGPTYTAELNEAKRTLAVSRPHRESLPPQNQGD